MSLDITLTDSHCEHCSRYVEVYSQNITHNLTVMAREAGLYKPIWRPDENGIKYARQLIKPLEGGIADMRARPDFYMKFDSPNGWGKYRDFLPWLERLLVACRECPNAKVEVSR